MAFKNICVLVHWAKLASAFIERVKQRARYKEVAANYHTITLGPMCSASVMAGCSAPVV